MGHNQRHKGDAATFPPRDFHIKHATRRRISQQQALCPDPCDAGCIEAPRCSGRPERQQVCAVGHTRSLVDAADSLGTLDPHMHPTAHTLIDIVCCAARCSMVSGNPLSRCTQPAQTASNRPRLASPMERQLTLPNECVQCIASHALQIISCTTPHRPSLQSPRSSV